MEFIEGLYFFFSFSFSFSFFEKEKACTLKVYQPTLIKKLSRLSMRKRERKISSGVCTCDL